MVCGWPIPIVIWQRISPNGHWIDFTGPITMFAFPINLIILFAVWFSLLWFINFVIIKIKKRFAMKCKEPENQELKT